MSYVLCMNCLRPKEGALCPHCGKWEAELRNDMDQLPVYSRLQEGRYIIGTSRKHGFGEEHGFSYHSWDSLLGRPVIVKEVARIMECATRKEVLEPGGFGSYYRENWPVLWNTQKRYALPGLPEIYDVFHHGDVTGVEWASTWYCIQEHVTGISLGQYMKDLGSELNAAATVRFLLPLMKDLARAHSAGLFHGDIDQHTVVLTSDHRVRFRDMFAAENIGNYDIPLPPASTPYSYWGQSEMGSQERRQREDIWRMGALFVYCLTGNTVDRTGGRKGTPIPVNWDRCDPVFTAPMRRVVERALSADVEYQYLTMAEFYADLVRCLG